MLYVVFICVFKFLYCISVVFMMQQLKSMGVLNHPISDQLELSQKIFEKVVMGGANTKAICSAPKHNIQTTPPQLDNTQRILRMIVEIPNICESITLKHKHKQAYMLPKSCIMELLKEGDWVDITVLQLWCS